MLSFTIWDYIIVFGYVIFVLAIGVKFRKTSKNLIEYVLAGRRLTLPLFVGTLVSTWYGGILGVGEITYKYGLVNWVTQGLFWYLSYFIFAFFLATRIRKSEFITIPDQLEHFYNRKTALLGAFLNFIMVVPCVYVLSLGTIIQLFFGGEYKIFALILGTIITLGYTYMGGFWADVLTDFVQFVFMCISVAILLFVSVAKFGSLDFLQNNLPHTHLTFTGTWSTQSIIIWGFLAMVTLVDPSFYQRCYAAQNPKIAKNGVLISIFFWFLFDICTTFVGLYSRAVLPNVDPLFSFPLYVDKIMPPILKGICFTGIIATVMSTVDSLTFLGALNFSNDFIKKFAYKRATNEQMVKFTKIGLIFTALVALIISIFSTSILNLWYTLGSVCVAAIMVPLLFSFILKKRDFGNIGLYSMLAGGLSSGTWLSYGIYYKNGNFLFNIEPLYIGLGSSLIVYFLFFVIKKRA
jgi:SSS family solute:Na+ symporter